MKIIVTGDTPQTDVVVPINSGAATYHLATSALGVTKPDGHQLCYVSSPGFGGASATIVSGPEPLRSADFGGWIVGNGSVGVPDLRVKGSERTSYSVRFGVYVPEVGSPEEEPFNPSGAITYRFETGAMFGIKFQFYPVAVGMIHT